jgi:hypothetical protein
MLAIYNKINSPSKDFGKDKENSPERRCFM